MEKSTENSGYFINVDEQGAEMVRLINQAQILTQELGGLFPEGLDLSQHQTILDVASGPGSWVLDVSWRYPDKRVIGTDVSPLLVQYATAMARAQKRPNAEFMVMDVLQPWPWSDASIDIVNARLMQGFMPMQSWVSVLQEAWRVTAPGGWIILTEAEAMSSSSRALLDLCEAGGDALYKVGRKITPGGLAQGFDKLLPQFLTEAGYSSPQLRQPYVNFSADRQIHDSTCRDLDMLFLLLKPFIMKVQGMKEEELDGILHQWNIDKYTADFTGRWDYVIVWAQKAKSE